MLSQIRIRVVSLLVLSLLATPALRAQDSISLVITHQNGIRPGLLVLAGPGLTLVRKVIDTDLQHSNRFEMAPLDDASNRLNGPFDSSPYRTPKASWVVELQPAGSDIEVKLHNLVTGAVLDNRRFPVDRDATGDARLAIHRVSDHIVKTITGGIGIASTRFLFKDDVTAVLYRIDADGENKVRVSPSGEGVGAGVAWSPDASRVAYAELKTGNMAIKVMTLATGNRSTVTTTSEHTNYNPTFSRDGKMLAFTKTGDAARSIGEIWTANTSNLASICCAVRLTNGRQNAASFHPTFHPEGQRIAFEFSLAAGNRQEIWVMDADGSSPTRLFAFAGNAHQPNWSPDGTKIAFDGELERGNFQVYVYDLVNQRTIQLTGNGANSNASWAPDSRHILFTRKQGGRNKLQVIDIETKEIRTIETGGDARWPAWSPTIGGPTP